MVLEPLSAFSVACNVLQVIDIGVKVLSKAAEYRKADAGALTEQKDLRDVSQSLNALNTDLQAPLRPQTASRQLTIEEVRLQQANDQCLRLSKELVNVLDRLKIRDRHVLLDSLRLSIKSLWQKDKMEAMEKSLSQARDNLNVSFLVYMNSKQATQTSQNELLKHTTRIEGSILQAMTSTSDSLQDDIKSLEEQLNNVNLDLLQQIVAQFTVSHHDLLEHLSNRLDSVLAVHADFRAFSNDSQTAAARQSILDSLYFAQIRERRDHITKAYSETYRWILEQVQGETQHWDDFVSWLRASSCVNRIYWVRGKIGAGKTTLLRFLDDNLSSTKHMLPWAGNVPVVRASCFFWNAGNKLQTSTTGLLRTLLFQLFEQEPELISRVVQPKKWQTASLAGTRVIHWTDSELYDCLLEYIVYVRKVKRVFLLIDGLDEFEGSDEERESLIDLLVELAAHENVKICLSSRPWNIFRDAFGSFPQLRLEDLTYNDIRTYVQEHLYSNRQFQKFGKYDAAAAEALKVRLISKAAGVFLWVRLVVRELLKGLRDGDGYRALSRKVEEIPADLNDYFMRLMESIEPQYRKESSELLQIALYQEHEFISLHSNCLLDFSFIEEEEPDFALRGYSKFNFTDTDAMTFRLESTIRKLNSRCLGLLECYDQDDEYIRTQRFDEDGHRMNDSNFVFGDRKAVPPDALTLLERSSVFNTAYLTVDFLHRSLRDFLLTPKAQLMLHQYTQGPYDARMFFRNARLVQLVALNKVENDLFAAIGLASYLVSTLAVPKYRDTPNAAAVASVIRPVIENIVRFEQTKEITGWYICCVLQSWHEEKSTFLTLAIDFGLDSYVLLHLTPENVHSKKGRPILDYLLRPRFPTWPSGTCVGHQVPDSALLNSVLSFGANPNQIFRGVSIWALFVCFVADRFEEEDSYNNTSVQEAAYLEALKIMVENGADTFLPSDWLSDAAYIRAYEDRDSLDEDSNERLRRRFPRSLPAIRETVENDTFYAVSDLLQSLQPRFRSSIDAVIHLVRLRELQMLASARYSHLSISDTYWGKIHQ